MSVVAAVVESTERYLDFLQKGDGGQTRLAATDILPLETGVLLEGSTRSTYSCKLPPRQQIWPDSSATLILSPAPNVKLEIHVQSYDRATGDLEFASKEPLMEDGNSGKIVIDFRWLVKRTLTWYQDHGTTIPDKLPRDGTSISFDPSEINEAGLSDEQNEAITAMLSSRFSYVWGPPGTGKTSWVLANAVLCSLNRSERVLVLASTNIAVDNALEAILQKGIPEEDVIRLGLPGPRFLDAHKTCCEARAFQREIAFLKSGIKKLVASIQAIAELQELESKKLELQAGLSVARQNAEKNSKTLDDLRPQVETSLAQLTRSERELKENQTAHTEVDSQLNELQFGKLLNDLRTLEGEDIHLIDQRKKLEADLESLGLFKKIFTGRKAELTRQVESVLSDLETNRETLRGRRREKDEIEPKFLDLQKRAESLSQLCRRSSEILSESKRGYESLSSKVAETESDLRKTENQKEKLSQELDLVGANLKAITHDHPDASPDELTDLENELTSLEKQLAAYEPDLSQKRVLGMTLDTFIGVTSSTSLSIDRVFIDEAPYAPLAKVLPLLSLNCPIAMLGDHRQLPPVCECTDNETIQAFWAKSAIFLEDTFSMPEATHFPFLSLWKQSDPKFDQVEYRKLTSSYRFGESLATLLDHYVYQMGLTGLASTDTEIRCIDCPPYDIKDREKRQNPAECAAILDRLEKWCLWAAEQKVMPSIAILTPYKNQVKLLRKAIKARFKTSHLASTVEVMNTHQAQGREWDWVLFSVADTGRLPMNAPYYTDSLDETGKPLLNTTLSRAKGNLRIFLDQGYWRDREPSSLLTEIVTLQPWR